MNETADMAERHREILTELAALGLALARDVQGRALAATDEARAAELALAFHRVSRSVRQTLALEARLERERRQVLREDAAEAARETLRRIQDKRARVRKAVTQQIWNEYEIEEDEAEALFEDLGTLVMDQSMEEGFLEAPVEACIARLRADLGLPAAPANADETLTEAETDGSDGARRSSA